MDRTAWGEIVGGIFGTGFVVANANAPWRPALADGVRGVAVAALVVLIIGSVWMPKHADSAARPAEGRPSAERGGWGWRYWLIVAGEVAVLFGGLGMLQSVGAPSPLNVAWIALVVGLHLLAFLMLWERPAIGVPGVALVLLGATGLGMGAAGSLAWISVVSGVASGFVLLGSCLASVAVSWLSPGASLRRRSPSRRVPHSRTPPG